jgi:hypothetical protein
MGNKSSQAAKTKTTSWKSGLRFAVVVLAPLMLCTGCDITEPLDVALYLLRSFL